MNRPVALITGASSGIGEALAREFAANGHDLIITARREARLETLAESLQERLGCEVMTLGADLASKSGVRTICKAIRDADWQVDVLVNNAGVAQTVPFSLGPSRQTERSGRRRHCSPGHPLASRHRGLPCR